MKDKIINLIILVVGIIILVSLVRSIGNLVKIGGQVGQAQQQLNSEKIKNIKLNRKLIQVQDPQFLEKMARDKLGLGKAGEMVVILPSVPPAIDLRIDPREIPNWQKWWEIFF